MKNCILLTLSLLLITVNLHAQHQRIAKLTKELKDADGKKVMVVAHRADWRGAPENSLLAIKNAIEMGVDIIEIDVRKTKDGQLIIMHDETVDRTTNGKGYIKDLTLDSLKKLSLRNGQGRVTYHKIPTLEEAMLVIKDKALVNLDKGYDYIREAYPILEKTGTVDHVLFKGYDKKAEQVEKDYGPWLKKFLYIAMVKLDDPGAAATIRDFQLKIKPAAFELNFTQDTSKVLTQLNEIKNKGSRVWINSLWASQNAGHDDDLAETNPEANYGWIIRNGANIIQTDRPKDLLTYLKSKNLHE